MSETCYHCGEPVVGKPITTNNHSFCCSGCKSVYLILQSSDLDSFYSIENKAGNRPGSKSNEQYRFLDTENFRKKFVEFEDKEMVKVTLFLPQIHCSSCVYLLENLSKINPLIKHTQVNFPKREATIILAQEMLLSDVATLLETIGYTPNFGNRKEQEKKLDRIFLYKIGIAGFAFGSIMLWSFPEYLGIDENYAPFRTFTAYLSLLISLPVLLFSARDYFISAYKALRNKSLNLDVPITLGIIALYYESTLSILRENGPGYMDSFAGFIFFLLIGKWFQHITYRSLSFEHDNAMYLPIAVCKISDNKESYVEVEKLVVGDEFLVRNEEIIPCDAEIISSEARIDYSFVTGEAEPVKKTSHDFVYAGGKIIGNPVKCKVLKESNRSHLTQLWNDVMQTKNEEKHVSLQDKLSVYFLIAVLVISGLSAIGWYLVNPSNVIHIVVSILIVACPCALALSSPFTLGNTLQWMGKRGFYLKNTAVVEKMNEITDIVFDKTGTLTSHQMHVSFVGEELTAQEKNTLSSLTYASTHPLSRALNHYLQQEGFDKKEEIGAWEEIKGEGITGKNHNEEYRIGNASFCGTSTQQTTETAVWVSINGRIKGHFLFNQEIREGIEQLLPTLHSYQLHVVSGDNEKDLNRLKTIFPSNTAFKFNQTPGDKFNYIQELNQTGRKVLMVGDGLNDSGALGAAHVGVAISENLSQFTPSSEAILEANKFSNLFTFLRAAKNARLILKICLTFSITYNSIGLSFAISGYLTPFVAAILMPVSSITIVFLSTVLVKLLNRR